MSRFMISRVENGNSRNFAKRWRNEVFFLALALSVLAVSAAPHRVWAQGGDPEVRFLEEAPARWDEYRKRAESYQGKVTDTHIFSYSTSGEENTTKIWVDFKQSASSGLLLWQDLIQGNEKEEFGYLRCKNANYGFKLRRTSLDAAWSVVNIGGSLSHGPWETPKDGIRWYARMPLNPPFVHDSKIKWYAKEDGFSLKSVAYTGNDGLVRVEFNFTPRDPRGAWLRGGSLILDPNHFWVIRSYEVALARPQADDKFVHGAASGSWDYKSGRGGLPIPHKLELDSAWPEEKMTGKYLYEYDLREESVSERDFTLTAYGFPEPFGMPTPPASRNYLWLAGGAFLLLTLSYFIYRRINMPR